MERYMDLFPGDRVFIDDTKIKIISMSIIGYYVGKGGFMNILKDPVYIRPTIVAPIFEGRMVVFIGPKKLKYKRIAVVRYYSKLGFIEYLNDHMKKIPLAVRVRIGDELRDESTPEYRVYCGES